MTEKPKQGPAPASNDERCARCQRGRRGRLEGAQGHEGRFCASCATMIRKCDRQGRPCPPFTGATWAKPRTGAKAPASPAKAAKAPGAPKEPRPATITQPRPADDGRTRLEPVPEPTASGLRLVFEVRIRPGMTPLEVMDLMRAVPSDAVVAG